MRVTYKSNVLPTTEMERIVPPPVVVTVNAFTESAVHKFIEDCNRAHNSVQSFIPIVINSDGGCVDALLPMIDWCRASKKPVATVVFKAMSCGAILASCGSPGYRFALAHSRIMIHDVSSWFNGKNADVQAAADESTRLNAMIYGILDENCKQKAGYFSQFIASRRGGDWFLTADEAKRHGLIDVVGMPEIRMTIDVSCHVAVSISPSTLASGVNVDEAAGLDGNSSVPRSR